MPRADHLDNPHGDFVDGRNRDVSQDSAEHDYPILAGEHATRAVLDALGEGLSIVDEKQQFLFVNPAGERLFGTERGRLNGRNLTEFIPPEGLDVIREQLSVRALEAPLLCGLLEFESRVDSLSLQAFDSYLGFRERLYDIKANSLRRRSERIVEKLNERLFERQQPSEGDAEGSHENNERGDTR